MDSIRNYKDKWLALSQPQKIEKLKIVAGVCYALFLLLFVIFAFGGTRSAERSPTKVVLFLEATPDALESIRYLALRADIAISMIVVGSSSWAIDAFQSVASITGFISMLRNEGAISASIPVYYGSSLSLSDCGFSKEIDYTKPPSAAVASPTACTYSRALSPKEHFLAERLFGVSEVLLEERERKSPTYYATPLQELLKNTTVQFLILGPATDAAIFLQQVSDSIRANVESIKLAGGAFTSKGNVNLLETTNTVAEINFFMDPQAANYLVSGRHGRPVTMIPLDASFAWDSSAYNTLIHAPFSVFPGQTSSSTVTGFAMSSFNKVFPHLATNVSVNFLAAVYLADPSLQSSSTVSIFPVTVTSESSLVQDGKSVYQPSNNFSSTVVLHVKEKLFWEGIIRVNALSSQTKGITQN